MKAFAAAFGILLLCLLPSAVAQPITVGAPLVEISSIPGFDHLPLRLPVTYGTGGSGDYGRLRVTSNATWVSGAIDAADKALVLSFTTSGLLNRTYTAELTVTDDSTSTKVQVDARVAVLNLTSLRDDPVRNRTYGLHEDAAEVGSLVVFNPLTLSPVGNLTVSRGPGDFAIRSDGNELLVISAARKLTAVDLATLRITETIGLVSYSEAHSDTLSRPHVAYGAGSIVYYVDGAWGPVLHVLNRATQAVLQSTFADGTAYTGTGNATSGFGHFVLSPDRGSLYAWSQYGYSAGLASSFMTRFTVASDGRLTFAAKTVESWPDGLRRDPIDSPALLSADGAVLFIKQFAVDPAALTTVRRTFPATVYSLSPGAEIVATAQALYDYETGVKLYDLPRAAPVQAITSDYARLIYYDSGARELKSVNLFQELGPKLLRRETVPAEGAIVLPPAQLQWTPFSGVDRYRVYLGTSQAAVTAATPSSPEYRGEVTGSSLPLSPLSSGPYFWRVDLVTPAEVTPGPVQSFTVSALSASRSSIVAATVQGDGEHRVAVELTASSATAWQASGSASWITFAASSGTTPSTLEVRLDARDLPPGIATGEVTLKAGAATVTLPVVLQVDPLALTILQSDAGSRLVYGISEANGYPTAGGATLGGDAYLLAIDTQAEKIVRVAPVGRGVTDLAVHHADNRIYVPNWREGTLLGVNLATFALERSYGFTAFGSIGYAEDDVFRVAAGGPGRIIVEEMDQWIDIAIYDTVNAKLLGKAGVREGGGKYGPDRRNYYHGENNSSGAHIRKFDTAGDQLVQVAEARGEVSAYYGSRTVVVTENGSRVFWSGVIYDANLGVVGRTGEIIHSASADGRYAFSDTKVFDTTSGTVAYGMPVQTTVSAFNSTSQKLVVQVGSQLRFYPVGSSASTPPPVLALELARARDVTLTWSTAYLQNGYTLQRRAVGATEWVDVAGDLPSTTTSTTVTGLVPETAYEFRVRAKLAGSATTGWSSSLAVTTLPAPAAIPQLVRLRGHSPTSVWIEWAMEGIYDSVSVERGHYPSGGHTLQWAAVATVPGPGTHWVDTGLAPLGLYYYRLRSTRAGSHSEYSYAWNSVQLTGVQTPQLGWTTPDRSIRAGETLELRTEIVAGNPWPALQWYKDDVALAGAVHETLILPGVSDATAGSYRAIATNSEGTATSRTVVVTVETVATRIVNLSILTEAGPATPLTVGFTSTGSAKTVLVRGMGPTLAPLGVSRPLPNPRLTLFYHPPGGGTPTQVGSNDDWSSAPNRNAILLATHRFTGLPFLSDPSADAALLTTLYVSGGYSVQLASGDGQTGPVLAEIYEADEGASGRLVNLSALTQIAPGRVLTAGFVLAGSTKQRLLLRGVGPALATYGVPGAHRDPKLSLYRQATTPVLIATNDDWSAAADKAAIVAASSVAGLTLADPSADAVLLVELEPGAYSMQVGSADGSTGLALAEVYELR